jgi:hypothetical protein
MLVVIRNTQAGLLQYERGIVVRLGQGRFHIAARQHDGSLSGAPQAFYYSGKHGWHPKGQTRLIIPTPTVLEACDICEKAGGFMPGGPWDFRTSF